ncbi:MAG: hypothetical protein IJ394_09740 [Bacteroidales bacterium]|nr:hypothetical protein [Bacteroidales bacterium]
MHLLRRLTILLLSFISCLSLAAQNQKQQEKDSLVVLLSSKSAQMVDVEGSRYRKVVGPARFLHNNTYLICDTAYWNVETQVIDAWGNVSILQEETVLTSDNLKYLIDDNLAQFRGSVVQLTDKDHNTLRTRHLDYNTQDSVAVFMNGGSMRDKDGQIIESRNGTYDSKVKRFTFENDVNMFTDSVFVKTKELVYESDLNLATFGFATDAWQDNNMLSSNSGWYDRSRELFFFTQNVHVMSEDQEGWCDSLFFYRNTTDVEMLGNAQVTDTTRNVFGLAGRLQYVDSLSRVTMTRNPAVISQTEEADNSIDTVYLGADKLVYYTMRMCDIPVSVVDDAQARLKALEVDPVGTFRKKAAEEAAKAAEEARKNDPNYRPDAGNKGNAPQGAPKRASAAPPDSLAKSSLSTGGLRRDLSQYRMNSDSLSVSDTLQARDSLSVSDSLALTDSLPPALDSLALADSLARADSLAYADSIANLDTTKIGFLEAIGKVRIFKKNMQVVCDSLLYSDLDSLARLFKEPLIWQETVRQYSADSVSLVVNDGAMEKASLMSNAFISIQEDTSHYDQIKGAEMLAFFDEKGGLKRFDVLGGASALFFLEENGALATVNKTDSKMLSAIFKDGEIQRIYYFEEAKNDGYPVVQLKTDERKLKGFNWQPEKRPADRNAVTPLSLRPSERLKYAARPRAQYKQTDIYFPGYMDDVYRQIEVRDSLRKVRERERAIAEREAALRDSLAMKDSLAAGLDSLALADSLGVALDSLALADSLAAGLDSLALADSLAVSDSLALADSLQASVVLTPEELEAKAKAEAKAEKERIRAEKKAALEAKRKARQEAKEARWAELDRRDAEKAAAKEEKRKEKERQRKRKSLKKAAKEAEKDLRTLEKYKRQYEKQKAREEEKTAAKAGRQ